MLGKDEFMSWLAESKFKVIDGGLATELEARGHDLNHPLWSAKLLREGSDSIKRVHVDYYLAGADVAITSSYQASALGLREQWGMTEEESEDLIKRSVQIALDARQEAYRLGVDQTRRLLVAGSVGPFGAYMADGSEYRGDYVQSEEQFKTFHRPRIRALVDHGVDLLALETMPSVTEIRAILSLLEDEFPNAIAWLSCTARDSERLSDGTYWEALLDVVHGHEKRVIAFGVNCVPIDIVAATLQNVRRLTSIALLCYPNSGETWDGETKKWQMAPDHELQEMTQSDSSATRDNDHSIAQTTPSEALLRTWRDAGAQLIGGCCRTGPDFVRKISNTLKKG